MRWWLTLTILFFSILTCVAQEPIFYASSDAKQTLTGAYFEVKFTLENGEGRAFKPPTFEGFKVVSGPNRSSQITIVNGKSSQKMSLGYTLLALKEGIYNIGSASIQVGSKRYASKPFKVEVVKGREKAKAINADGLPTDEMIFVRAEVSDTLAYVGQQITVNYKLYTSQDIQSYDITSQPDFDGFYVENVKDFRNTFNREVIDGIQYRTRVLKTYALFPQRTGTFSFEPMYLRLGIPYKDKNARSFFFNTRVRPMAVNTNPVNIEVKTLPEDSPKSFSGAVGKYTMKSFTPKTRISTDDALTIYMEVRGNGDGRQVSIPEIELPPSFEMYDPKLTKDENLDKNGKVTNYKIFEFVAVPQEPGTFIIAPQFSYFDTDSAKYITLEDNPFRVEVSKGNRKKSSGHSFISDAANTEMRSMMSDFAGNRYTSSWFGTKTFWGFSSVLLIGFLSVIGVKVIKFKKKEKDPATIRKENAQRVALNKLEKAKLEMQSGNERAFYEEIALAFWGYASDQLEIESSDQSKEFLSNKLYSMNIEQSLIDEYLNILKDCEMVNYAGVGNTNMQDFYNRCIQLITTIQQAITFPGK